MSDDEIITSLTNGARTRAAIAAGLENAPIGITTPGTKNSKYFPTRERDALPAAQ
jgi:hypothetical protein